MLCPDLIAAGFGVYQYPNPFFRYEGTWLEGKKHGMNARSSLNRVMFSRLKALESYYSEMVRITRENSLIMKSSGRAHGTSPRLVIRTRVILTMVRSRCLLSRRIARVFGLLLGEMDGQGRLR